MSGSSPRPGTEPRAVGPKVLLAVAAVLVLGGTVALAIYVRSSAGGESEAPGAAPVAAPPARTTPPAGPRVQSRPAPALESHEMPLAEDRFLGQQQPGAPSTTRPAPPPPEPPRAPTDPADERTDVPSDPDDVGAPR